jgi:1-acyl-sn-glycerol-3-phosphate acyltransferase
MKSYLNLFFSIAFNVKSAQSFQAIYHPQIKRQTLLQREVGLSHLPPSEYTEQKYSNPLSTNQEASKNKLSQFESLWTKYCMIAYVAHMCVALPISLMPTFVKTKLNMATKAELEHEALQVGQACARSLLQLIPFMNLKVIPHSSEDPVPTIWVSNHVSMLDTFVFLAADEQLRGKNRRPIKTIYWKGLDANPVCKILFTMAGFIPVDMEDNGNGNPNEYHPASFKQMIKATKKAVADGFDILILPEGQLNPKPLEGLQPVFPGAYALAKSSGRPIQMVALHGCHNLWHADDDIGMTVTAKDVSIKAYPPLKDCDGYDDFLEAFSGIVGTFGSTGKDPPQEELKKWLVL